MGDWQQNPHQTKWTKYDWWSYIILQFLFHFGGYTVDANDYLQKQPGCVETRLLVLSNKKRWFQALLVVWNRAFGFTRPIHVIQGIGKDYDETLQRMHRWAPEAPTASRTVVPTVAAGFWGLVPSCLVSKKSLPCRLLKCSCFLLIWFYQTWGCVQICATLFKSALMWYPSGICMIFGGWWVPGIFKLEVFNRDPHN